MAAASLANQAMSLRCGHLQQAVEDAGFILARVRVAAACAVVCAVVRADVCAIVRVVVRDGAVAEVDVAVVFGSRCCSLASWLNGRPEKTTAGYG